MKVMSEIKEDIDKKTSLTGTAAHFQQELSVKEQSCGKNGYGNVFGGLQVNRTNDWTVNMLTEKIHLISKMAPARRHPAHDKQAIGGTIATLSVATLFVCANLLLELYLYVIIAQKEYKLIFQCICS